MRSSVTCRYVPLQDSDEVKRTLVDIAHQNLRKKLITSFKLQENSQVELDLHLPTCRYTTVPCRYVLHDGYAPLHMSQVELDLHILKAVMKTTASENTPEVRHGT